MNEPLFIADDKDNATSREKNTMLSNYLNGAWNKYTAIEIKRIDEAIRKGWELTYK